MEDYAEAGKGPTLLVQVPKDTGEYLMNNKRNYINRTEENYEMQINLQIRPDLEIPHYRIERQWTDDGQQRIEVLEDTMKGKKPARGGRKLKPSVPIVGIPTFEDEVAPEKAEKGNLLTKISDLLFGPVQRRKEEAKRKAEEERKAKEDAERAERNSRRRGGRRRGGRGRRPGTEGGAETNPVQTQGKTSVDSPSEPRNTEGKPSRNKRPRKRKEAGEKVQSVETPTETEASAHNTPSDEPKAEGNGTARRRRRRRPRRPAGEQGAATQDNGSEQASSANQGQADAGSAEAPQRKPEPVAAAPAPASTSAGE